MAEGSASVPVSISASEVVKRLDLTPHPDGGFYLETHRDTSVVISTAHLPSRYKVDRPVSTAIYFLLPSGSVAVLHRIPCAETFHYYFGEPITVFELNEEDGRAKLTCVGPDLHAGQRPQYTVPPYVWFGSFPAMDVDAVLSHDGGKSVVNKVTRRDPERHYSLVGVTCAPAFQYEDSENGKRSDLVARFPQHESFISLLTSTTSSFTS